MTRPGQGKLDTEEKRKAFHDFMARGDDYRRALEELKKGVKDPIENFWSAVSTLHHAFHPPFKPDTIGQCCCGTNCFPSTVDGCPEGCQFSNQVGN
jgi:hypothetical protein